MKKKYYAYFINENTFGIVESWPMCQEICKGVKSKYKSFDTKEEAESWLKGDSEIDSKSKVKKYYAVHFVDSRTEKIYYDWDKCQKEIKDKKTRYKSFKTEKEAIDWLRSGANYENKEQIKANLEEGIYFDAGTGRGIGVEVRVTDKRGKSLVNEVVPDEKVNEFGNYLCPKESTNNYGELMGIYIALKLAAKIGELKIFGDSKLIIEYWSKGFAKINELNEETAKLIGLVKELRIKFEEAGGKVQHVSGDYNPSDLGFHR